MKNFNKLIDEINNYTDDSSNVGYKKQKRSLLIIMIILACTIAVYIGMIFVNNNNNQYLLDNTPLKNHSYFYSMDNFPKYKLDMVKRVDKLIQTGVDENEACLIAIEETSDKIYEDKLAFIDCNAGLEAEELEEKYMEFLDKTQR